MLERSVYSTSLFKKQSKDFVFCKINADTQPSVLQQWGVSALPTIKFLTKDLKEVHGFVGYKPTHEFIAEMNKARGN
jgi:thioredoxin-like negative regulator of GroEL